MKLLLHTGAILTILVLHSVAGMMMMMMIRPQHEDATVRECVANGVVHGR